MMHFEKDWVMPVILQSEVPWTWQRNFCFPTTSLWREQYESFNTDGVLQDSAGFHQHHIL